MKDKIQNWKSDDDMVDKVVVHLRDEHVPAMPRQLLEGVPDAEHATIIKHSRTSFANWMVGVAAVVLAMIVIAAVVMPERGQQIATSNQTPVDVRDGNANESTEVKVQNLGELRMFEGLEREMAAMESEIEQLKIEAASLDVIRKINAMMAQN